MKKVRKKKVYKKILTVKITGCSDCPYCQYDGDYGMSYSDGWDCTNDDATGTRIIDNANYLHPKMQKEHDKEFERLMHKQPPDWCPLPNIRKRRTKC